MSPSSGMAVACAVDGAVVEPSPTVRQFLTDLPRCAYTTALVRDAHCVADWDMHVERLLRTMRALHRALDDMYAAFYSWLEVRKEVLVNTVTQWQQPLAVQLAQMLWLSVPAEL